jgi:glycine cleavage system H lipoate-binding protein
MLNIRTFRFGLKIYTHNLLKNYRNIRNSTNSTNFTTTSTGEWIKKNNYKNKNISTIGLTKHSIEQLSEIVYIDPLVEIGDKIDENEEIIALESVKATASINALNDCEIIDINYDLFEDLDSINNDPENTDKCWIIKTTP